VPDEASIALAKKQQKRLANRKSAQLSRKRKKMYVEELQEQNSKLKRKVEILKHVPDLVLAFHADTGVIDFSSDAADQLLASSPQALVDTSVWDVFCAGSKLLLEKEIEQVLKNPLVPGSQPVALDGTFNLVVSSKSVTASAGLHSVSCNGVVSLVAGYEPAAADDDENEEGAAADKEESTVSTPRGEPPAPVVTYVPLCILTLRKTNRAATIRNVFKAPAFTYPSGSTDSGSSSEGDDGRGVTMTHTVSDVGSSSGRSDTAGDESRSAATSTHAVSDLSSSSGRSDSITGGPAAAAETKEQQAPSSGGGEVCEAQ
jgi:hypothetical protein